MLPSPPPHKIGDGFRGMGDERAMTVKFAKTLHVGATLSLPGNLIEHKEEDRYLLRDKTGAIEVIFAKAVTDRCDYNPIR